VDQAKKCGGGVRLKWHPLTLPSVCRSCESFDFPNSQPPPYRWCSGTTVAAGVNLLPSNVLSGPHSIELCPRTCPANSELRWRTLKNLLLEAPTCVFPARWAKWLILMGFRVGGGSRVRSRWECDWLWRLQACDLIVI